jgi:hypothetical protein
MISASSTTLDHGRDRRFELGNFEGDVLELGAWHFLHENARSCFAGSCACRVGVEKATACPPIQAKSIVKW